MEDGNPGSKIGVTYTVNGMETDGGTFLRSENPVHRKKEISAGTDRLDLTPFQNPLEPKGGLIVEARNGFKELILNKILCSVRHVWNFGIHMVFNFYRHSALLIFSRPEGTANILHSSEGFT